jgi:hypothetical protein
LPGCDIYCLILWEEHRLRAFDNRALRRMFTPKTNEVRGGWRKANNREFHNLYPSPDIIRIIE